MTTPSRGSVLTAEGRLGNTARIDSKEHFRVTANRTVLWNKYSLKIGDFAYLMTKSPYVTPIHKGGSRQKPEQYRPVSLTSHVMKVFERVIKKKIMEHLE